MPLTKFPVCFVITAQTTVLSWLIVTTLLSTSHGEYITALTLATLMKIRNHWGVLIWFCRLFFWLIQTFSRYKKKLTIYHLYKTKRTGPWSSYTVDVRRVSLPLNESAFQIQHSITLRFFFNPHSSEHPNTFLFMRQLSTVLFGIPKKKW